MKHLKMYIPIKKQMRWTDNNALDQYSYPEQNLYFVYWFVQLGHMNTGKVWNGSGVRQFPIEMNIERVNYFTNSAMYS